jgi:hypothetical protein
MLKRSFLFSIPVDVERHARDFMEDAKGLQLYFIGLQREDQTKLVHGWRKELRDHSERHKTELE